MLQTSLDHTREDALRKALAGDDAVADAGANGRELPLAPVRPAAARASGRAAAKASRSARAADGDADAAVLRRDEGHADEDAAGDEGASTRAGEGAVAAAVDGDEVGGGGQRRQAVGRGDRRRSARGRPRPRP